MDCGDKMKQHRQQKRQRGFSLIELAIALGVAGLIVGGIWAAAGAAYETHRVNQTVDQVRQIVENVRGRYATASQLPNNFYDGFTQLVAAADLFPAETRLDPTRNPATCTVGNPCYFANPWSSDGVGARCNGGTICISANQPFGGANILPLYNFTLMLRNLPQQACIKVGSALMNLSTDIGLVAVGTDTADNTPPANSTNVATVAWFNANCSGVNPNHLYLVFRLSP